MRFFTLSSLAAAALASAVVAVPFLPLAKKKDVGLFALEVRMVSTAAGKVQVYYPDRRNGLSDEASSYRLVVPGTTPVQYRLPLPPGSYSVLRFDPLDREGAVQLDWLRITDHRGRIIRSLAFAELRAGREVASLTEHDGKIEIRTTPGALDPQIGIYLEPPLVLRGTSAQLWDGLWTRALAVFLGLAGILLLFDRVGRARQMVSNAARSLAGHPLRAVMVTATASVVLSTYPVIFLGKSHVSPNFGTHLLYDGFPTLPGSRSNLYVDPKGADVGAMMWAHLPYSMVEHRALAGGELPLWNRYNSLGAPLLGQGQSMLGDPLHLWVLLWNGAAWAWDVKFIVAKWLFATGLGLLVLAVTTNGNSHSTTGQVSAAGNAGAFAAALTVASAAPFIGFFIYRINHAAYFSLSYAPWPLYCWLRATRATGWRAAGRWAAGLIVANLALMNSGTVKEAYLLLLTMNFSGAGVLLTSAAPWRVRLGKLAVLAWAGVIFVLLTAPIWSTFLHTLANAETNYTVRTAFQIQPSLLLGAFDEAFYRPIPLAESIFNPSANFIVLLGLLYFLVTVRFHLADRAALALAVSALVCAALAFGLVPPSWIAALPLIGNVQHIDNCFSCALIVLWSVLAGVGFARAARRLATAEGDADLLAVGGLLFALVFAWIAFRQTVHRGYIGAGGTVSVVAPGEVIAVSGFVWGYLASLLTASVALAIAVRRSLRLRVLSPAMALIIGLCALLMLGRQGLHAEAIGFETHIVRPPPRADFHAKSPAMEWARAAQAREPGRGYGLHENFFVGWTGVYGLEAINSADALMNPRVHELIGLCGVTPGITWDFTLPPENLAGVLPFLDFLNVRYYFNRGRDREILQRSLSLVHQLDLDIWTSPTVWPRAFFTDRVDVYDDAADLMKKIKSGDRRPFAAVQRSDPGAWTAVSDLKRELTNRTVTAAERYRLTENTTAFSVHANAAGVIVLSETFWPGDFRAEVNGRKVPVLRLNHAFKGVVVNAPGDYDVIFRYVPRNFPRLLGLSGIGAALLALSLWLVGRRPS